MSQCSCRCRGSSCRSPLFNEKEENTVLEAKIMYLLESTVTKINYQMMRLGDEIVYRRNLRRVKKMEKRK